MKHIFFLIILSVFFSCGNKKVLHLPEISHSEITDIKDVSHAYLFYDETQKDSIELNRKNLISTTNWLINVDKRLTLKQAIPHLKFLQEKKQNSSHKNKEAKNYFTCNDISRKNLGFIEFTGVVYHEEPSFDYFKKISDIKVFQDNMITLYFDPDNKVMISNSKSGPLSMQTTRNEFIDVIKKNDSIKSIVYLNLNKVLSFNDYITIKSKFLNLNSEHIQIDKNEFIY